MANGTWTNSDNDYDWSNANNWSGGIPGDGDTATFNESEGSPPNPPTSNIPTGITLHLALVGTTHYGSEGHGLDLSAITGNLSGLTLGNISLSGTVDVGVAQNWATMTVTGADAVGELGGSVAGNVALDGGVFRTRAAGATLTGNVTTTASGGRVNWVSNVGIVGTFNASGPVTHEEAASGTLTVNAASTLNLGGDATGLAVTVSPSSGTVTAGADATCGALALSSGTLARGTYTINVASYAGSGGTLTGDATTGALRVAGNIAISGGTNTSSGQVVQCGTGMVAITPSGSRVQHLVLAGSGANSTVSDNTYTLKLTTGTGTVTIGSAYDVTILSPTDNCLVLPATTSWPGSNTRGVQVSNLGAGLSIAQNAITLGRSLRFSPSSNAAMTATGRWQTGTLRALPNNAGTASVVLSGHELYCLGIELGSSAGLVGAVTLGPRTTIGANGITVNAGTGTLTVAAGSHIALAGAMTATSGGRLTATVGGGTFIQGTAATASLAGFVPSEEVYVNGVADGGSNHANVKFNRPPRNAWVAAA